MGFRKAIAVDTSVVGSIPVTFDENTPDGRPWTSIFMIDAREINKRTAVQLTTHHAQLVEILKQVFMDDDVIGLKLVAERRSRPVADQPEWLENNPSIILDGR